MKAYIFIETGEVRRPRRGDEYLGACGSVLVAKYDFMIVEFPILRRVEVEVPKRGEGKVDFGECCGCQRCFDSGVDWLATHLGIELKD